VEASVDGHPVAIGAGKPRALFAMLALRAGSTVSSDRLIEGLWGESPPATASKMVQLHVSQLRKALAVSGNGAEIFTRGHGYELRVAQEVVDTQRFERLVARGMPREALALWRVRRSTTWRASRSLLRRCAALPDQRCHRRPPGPARTLTTSRRALTPRHTRSASATL
jgi:DNA-binding SARP family transcriptional activator